MKTTISHLSALLLSFLSGLLVALAFPPWNLEWLIWIGLTPVLAALLLFESNWLFSLLRGALFGVVFSGITFYWLLQSGRPIEWLWNLGSLSLVGAIWGFLVNRFVDLPIKKTERAEKVSPILPGSGSTPEAWSKSVAHLRAALFAAATWTVLEWARGVLLPGWNTLGSALQTNLPLLQMATVTGASGLSFVIVFANLVVLSSVRRLILEPGRMSWASRFDVTATLGGIFLIALAGFAFLQPSASKDSKAVGLLPTKSTDVSELISKSKLDHPVDLWVWRSAQIVAGDYLKFGKASIGKDVALVTRVASGDRGSMSGAVIVTPGAVKNIVIIPRPYPLFQPGVNSPGRTLNSFNYKETSWVPLLNWEGGDLLLVRGAITKGVQVLISLSDFSPAPPAAGEQMFANLRFLALSLGRPMIFSNAEFSAIATSSGKIVAKSNTGDEPISGQIEPLQPFDVTLYGRYGDWFAIGCGAIMMAMAISRRFQRANENPRRFAS
jgi:apolipoprotein N-acyltransferase